MADATSGDMSGRAFVQCVLDASPRRVIVAGEIDIASQSMLDEASELLRAQGPDDVVVDLSAVSFMGCNGVTFLVRLAARLRPSGNRVHVLTANRLVLRVLHLSGAMDAVQMLHGIRTLADRRLELRGGGANQNAAG